MLLRNSASKILNFVLILALVFLLVECSKHKINVEKLSANQAVLLNAHKQAVRQIGEGQWIQNQTIVQNEKTIQKLLDSIEGLSKVKGTIRVITNTVVRNVEIPIYDGYLDSVNADEVVKDCLEVPALFTLNEEWYNISGTIHKKHVKIDSLGFKNDVRVSWGYEDRGFWKNNFGKKIGVIKYEDKNPYSSLSSMQNIIVEDRNMKRNSIGFQIGFGATRDGITPYIGFGYSRDLYRF